MGEKEICECGHESKRQVYVEVKFGGLGWLSVCEEVCMEEAAWLGAGSHVMRMRVGRQVM